MNDFNWSMYDENAEYNPTEPLPKKQLEKPFDWNQYDGESPAQPKSKSKNPFEAPNFSVDELEKMSISDKIDYAKQIEKEQDYNFSKAFSKEFASGQSFGFSEKIEGFAPEEDDDPIAGFFGKAVGEVVPIGGAFKILSWPLKYIPKGYKWANRFAKTAVAAGVGATLETGKQAVKNEGFDPEKIATNAASFAIVDGAIRSIVGGYNWLKQLSPKQQGQIMFEGVAPENLTEQQYKFYKDKYVPVIQAQAEQEYQQGFQRATQELEQAFEQEVNEVNANYEKKVYKNDFEYENKLKQVAAEHQGKQQALDEMNSLAMEEFQEKKLEWDLTAKRQDAVQEAIGTIPQETPQELNGRVQTQGEDVGIRPEAFSENVPSLKDRVGSVISKNRIKNRHDAGQKNIKTVRASDEVDYKAVQDKYKINDELNNQVETTHSNLTNQLRSVIEDINIIPEPSSPQIQVRETAKKVLNAITEFDEFGNVIGLKDVSNKVLLEQAKALRYSMDFDFAHGNPTGVLQPLVNILEEAAQNAALSVGNLEAVAANKAAKSAHKAWAELYRNPLITKYRDVGNFQPQATFDNSLTVDNYIQLDKVLSRTNAGQQLSAQTRRELITKQLDPFFKNPKEALTENFNEVLNELEPILEAGESQQIKNQFNEARRTPVIQAKKIEPLQEPKKPESKFISKVKIPLKKEIRKPNIPYKPEVKITTEMNEIAKRMKITPEQAIAKTNSPSGWRDLKKWSSGSEAGQQLFREAGKKYMKEALYGGNVRHKITGHDWQRVLSKSENFDIFSEILGEDVATDMLNAAESMSAQQAKRDLTKETIKKAGTIKVLKHFGLWL